MKNFLIYFFYFYDLLNAKLSRVDQLLTYYFRISAIFRIIDQSTLPLDHVPYAHSDSQT